MTFKGDMQLGYYYYFVINKYGPTGTQTTNGPVPVLAPVIGTNQSYGNGFATGSSSTTNGTISGTPDYGLTDFVLYHSGQGFNSIGLYHFTRDPNTQPDPANAILPINVVLPSAGASEINPQGAKTLQFDIYMAQLVRDTTDIKTQNAAGQNIEYINVNIIATDNRPVDVTTPVIKNVDAMGDTLSAGTNGSLSANSFLQIHLTESRTYTSSDPTSSLQEREGDVYPSGDQASSLDLLSWTIQVIPN